MKKLISIILLSAMLLTACGKEEASVETTVSETAAITTSVEVTAAKAAEEEIQIDEDIIPQDEMGQGMLDYVLGDYIDEDTDPVLLTGERAERLEEAFRNIRINNSRFALPMMIYSLPEGFKVKYDKSSEHKIEGWDFNYYSGELYCGKELCANIGIIRKEDAEEDNGIIVSFVAMSNQCKWEFDGIEFSNDEEKIIQKFGEPSFNSSFTYMENDSITYVSDIGSTVIFMNEINAFFCINFNFKNTFANALFVESVPYDDFDNMPEAPRLSGKPREIDWNMVFEDDCIVIGNDKYPANVKISDFSEDITLFEYGIAEPHPNNDDYYSDKYLLMYKGREIGMLGAARLKDEQPENAQVYSWIFMSETYPMPVGVMGFSPEQSIQTIERIYKISGDRSRAEGICEQNGEKYHCWLILIGDSVFLDCTPYYLNPEAYDEFVNSQ